MTRQWRTRIVALVLVGAIVEWALVAAGTGPRFALVAALVAAVGAALALAVDVGDDVATTEWPRSLAAKTTSEGLDWRVGSLRVLLLNERRTESANARLHAALVDIVDERLAARRSIDRTREPERAAAALGPELTRLLDAAPPVAALFDHRQVAHLVTLIERI